jgi:hypothetical protein
VACIDCGLKKLTTWLPLVGCDRARFYTTKITTMNTIEFRFKNEYIDSTVTVQEDGSVVERLGAGGELVQKPQKFASVRAWLNAMQRDTDMCSHDPRYDSDDEEDEAMIVWFVPTKYSYGRRTARNTPDGDVVERSRTWSSPEEWAAEIIASMKAKKGGPRRSKRLAAKPAVNYTEEEEVEEETPAALPTVVVTETPAVLPAIVVSETPKAKASAPAKSKLSDEEHRIVANIKGFLDRCNAAKEKKTRAAIATEFFYFIAVFCKEFCTKHKRFGNTVITKAYEFKKYESDSVDLMRAADNVLLALGSPLDIPVPLPVLLPVGKCGSCAKCGAEADKIRARIEATYQKSKATAEEAKEKAAAEENEKEKVKAAAEEKEKVKAAAVAAASAALAAAATALTAALNA